MIIAKLNGMIDKKNIVEFKERMEIISALTKQEKGCLFYEVSQHLLEDGHISFFEVWETKADLDAHLATPHMVSHHKTVSPMFPTGFSFEIYDVQNRREYA